MKKRYLLLGIIVVSCFSCQSNEDESSYIQSHQKFISDLKNTNSAQKFFQEKYGEFIEEEYLEVYYEGLDSLRGKMIEEDYSIIEYNRAKEKDFNKKIVGDAEGVVIVYNEKDTLYWLVDKGKVQIFPLSKGETIIGWF